MRRTVDPKLGFFLATLSVSVALDIVGCSANDGGIADESGGKSTRGGTASGSGGRQSNGGASSGGANSNGGTSSDAGAPGALGGANPGEAGASSDEGGGGSDVDPPKGGSGGAANGGAGNEDAGGAGNIVERCVFHTPDSSVQALGMAGASAEGGAPSSGGTENGSGGAELGTGGSSGGATGKGGTGGGGGVGGGAAKTSITIQKSGFVGTYLADSAGKALYLYGADQPGDCNYEPITNCFDDCLIAWPIFDASPRTLPPELDDGLFGTITRPDGPTQMTYMGWPLYYYKSDLAPREVKGQGAGKIWHLAEPILPNIVILRIPDPGGTSVSFKVLGSEMGRSLYTFAEDKLGTKTTHPSSACVGPCLEAYEPFVLDYLSPVSYLEPSEFTYFVRSDGTAQIAYKGAPLYLSYADLRSGDMNGVTTTGWALAAP